MKLYLIQETEKRLTSSHETKIQILLTSLKYLFKDKSLAILHKYASTATNWELLEEIQKLFNGYLKGHDTRCDQDERNMQSLFKRVWGFKKSTSKRFCLCAECQSTGKTAEKFKNEGEMQLEQNSNQTYDKVMMGKED